MLCLLPRAFAHGFQPGLVLTPGSVERRIEYLEASTCNLLACTLAWHAASPAGFRTLQAAVLDAEAALSSLISAATGSAPSIQASTPMSAIFAAWRYDVLGPRSSQTQRGESLLMECRAG